ncbi:hypothetical protein CVT25_008739 [Psilocybe cyanescens]|uniref:DUF1742-domain-containing protein n=1 Tax=Psilocybe cyanescens TaxID=93625 RepID=A0A409XNL5_PSICY|nr:hypothetical protein CVT25_008739 [Psilocybe cyanescens]
MSFTNVYYKRTAGTPKACYACYKPTTTVLATINTVDFLYTCPIHLTDSGFATLISDGDNEKSSISTEEIARVKAEWEEKQKKKLEKEKEKEKDKDKNKDKETDTKDKDTKKETSKSPQIPGSPNASPSPSTSTVAHQRYVLNREIFSS